MHDYCKVCMLPSWDHNMRHVFVSAIEAELEAKENEPMANNEPINVAVPVELLKKLEEAGHLAHSLKPFIPKPRLVAVELRKILNDDGQTDWEYLDYQPNLLTLLDDVLDDFLLLSDATDLKGRIRIALGVDE